MTRLVKRTLIGMGMAGSLAIGWAISGDTMVGGSFERTGRNAAGQPAVPSRNENDQVLAAITALRQEMGRLGGKVTGLSAEVARIERQGRQDKTSAVADAQAEDDTPQDETAQGPRAAAEANRQTERFLDTVEANFQAEKLDTKWASEVSGTIVQAFAEGDEGNSGAGAADMEETLAGSSLDKVECRSTSCRLEVSHADPEAFETFVHGLASKLGGQLPLVTIRPVNSPGGGLATVVYLSRKR